MVQPKQKNLESKPLNSSYNNSTTKVKKKKSDCAQVLCEVVLAT